MFSPYLLYAFRMVLRIRIAVRIVLSHQPLNLCYQAETLDLLSFIVL